MTLSFGCYTLLLTPFSTPVFVRMARTNLQGLTILSMEHVLLTRVSSCSHLVLPSVTQSILRACGTLRLLSWAAPYDAPLLTSLQTFACVESFPPTKPSPSPVVVKVFVSCKAREMIAVLELTLLNPDLVCSKWFLRQSGSMRLFYSLGSDLTFVTR